MAEFCLNCYLKDFPEDENIVDRIIMSKDTGLCEGCGNFRPVVVKIKKGNINGKLRNLFKKK